MLSEMFITFAIVRRKIANLFYEFGGSLCKALVCGGLVVYMVHAFRSDHPGFKLFLKQHEINSGCPAQLHSSSDWTTTSMIPTSLSHIVFGVVGSANTWRKRGPYIDLWWRPNKTRGFVWLERAPTGYLWPSTSPPFLVSEDISRFKPYDKHGMRFAIRMTRVILEAFRLGMEDVRWFVMADDDTVLFVNNLVDVLAGYDHHAYYYIGGISECVFQNAQNSFKMAFGGAGYAISYPLAKALVRILDGCIMRYPYLWGSDHIIQSCMSELGVSLTRHLGFHQFDLHGDISGLLSAHPLAPLLSFHHLDSVDPIFPGMSRSESLQQLMKAAEADSSRLLQQTICYDKQSNWSLSVSWGYSVQLYEKVLPPGFLEIPVQTFRPWNKWGRPPFMFNVRPLSNDPSMAPHVFYFESIEVDRDQIVTTYNRTMPRLLSACTNHSADVISRIQVISPANRLAWGRGQSECCGVLPSSTTNPIEIRVKNCFENEVRN